MKHVIKYILYIVPLIVLFLGVKQAQAETLSLGISPTVFQINTKTPADIDAPFSLANLSSQTVALKVIFRPFSSSEADDGTIQPLGGNQMSGANPFILENVQVIDGNQPVTNVTLGPQQKKILHLHMSFPINEPPSDYYFSIVFISTQTNTTTTATSTLNGGIAANVLLSIGPTDGTKGTVENFSTPFFKQNGPVSFNIKVANQSSHFIVPRGNIVITNMFGEVVGNVTLQPVNVLEHSSRFMPDDISGNPTQAIWQEKVLLGFYQAKLTVALSADGPIFSRTIYFFVLPWQILVGAFFVILLLLIIVERVRLRMIKKK